MDFARRVLPAPLLMICLCGGALGSGLGGTQELACTKAGVSTSIWTDVVYFLPSEGRHESATLSSLADSQCLDFLTCLAFASYNSSCLLIFGLHLKLSFTLVTRASRGCRYRYHLLNGFGLYLLNGFSLWCWFDW